MQFGSVDDAVALILSEGRRATARFSATKNGERPGIIHGYLDTLAELYDTALAFEARGAALVRKLCDCYYFEWMAVANQELDEHLPLHLATYAAQRRPAPDPVVANAPTLVEPVSPPTTTFHYRPPLPIPTLAAFFEDLFELPKRFTPTCATARHH